MSGRSRLSVCSWNACYSYYLPCLVCQLNTQVCVSRTLQCLCLMSPHLLLKSVLLFYAWSRNGNPSVPVIAVFLAQVLRKVLLSEAVTSSLQGFVFHVSIYASLGHWAASPCFDQEAWWGLRLLWGILLTLIKGSSVCVLVGEYIIPQRLPRVEALETESTTCPNHRR
jgi:hypothetical protein